MNDLSEPITRALLTERYRKELVRCSDHWRDQGVNITGYTTAESAADLEDLRQVLGADQLDFVAISYGTHLAMAAMRQGLPIGRAVLTGLEGPDQTVKLPVHFDAFLDRVNAALAADERASAVFGDLRAMMRRVHARLDEAPAQVEITDREGASHLIQFDSFAAKLATSFALISDPARIARLPGFYAEMDMGSYQRVGMFLHRALQTQMGALRGMPELMDAASGISKERAALVEAQSQNALLGDAGNFPMPHVSGAINGLDLGPDFRSDFATDIPVLAIMGTMDGRTPLESQAEILPFFTSSRTITVKNGGHNIFEQSEDLQSQIVAYLQNGEVIIDEISLPPIAFAVPE